MPVLKVGDLFLVKLTPNLNFANLLDETVNFWKEQYIIYKLFHYTQHMLFDMIIDV